MNSLTSLALLVFVASAFLLVEAGRNGRGKQVREKIPDEDEYVGSVEECATTNERNCSYHRRQGCDCMPPLPNGRNRFLNYFYSPKKNRCFLSPAGLDSGCNSFENEDDCWRECVRKKPRSKRVVGKQKKN
uniref:Putative secreted protein n=1 Tax=Amblyomma cajennense TaxID=34607 RepID=A0A023FG01_AMBCJ